MNISLTIDKSRGQIPAEVLVKESRDMDGAGFELTLWASGIDKKHATAKAKDLAKEVCLAMESIIAAISDL